MEKEEIKEYNRKYYAEHKEEIKKSLSKKEDCEICGRKVSHSSMNRHKKSSLCRANAKHDVTALVKRIAELETRVYIK
jgi:hypothetical protein